LKIFKIRLKQKGIYNIIMKEKIKINGKEFNLIRKVYDAYNECYFYYTEEADEPFCDLCDDIEEARYEIH